MNMNLDQKAALIEGATTWTTRSAPGLRALHLADGPHGIRSQGAEGDSLGIGDSIPAVCFPPAVALGATWNPGLVRRVGEALGDEASGLGVDVLLGPGLNIKRSPLGGRNFEYLSEDPHVTGVLASQLVQGIQSRGVAATPKHFAVNNQETDRMRVSATVSQRALREIYLSAFERVVREARPWAFMSAYNRVNGTFASESRWLLTEVLRDEWGFDGLMMSDWGAVDEPARALAAGLDLEMPPSGRTDRITTAIRSGELTQSVLDLAVRRLRTLAERTAAPTGIRDVAAGEAVALDAAREAVTLLENDGILPLASGTRVLVVGEFARTPRFQGGGSSRVNPTRVVSALEALAELHDGPVSFEPGFTLGRDESIPLADAALAAAPAHDAVLLFLGLPDHAESEGFDRAHLSLPADQLALLARLDECGVPIVVVLSNGAVVDIATWRNAARAVVEGWLLGQEGGRAIAEVLTGAVNPSGRLTETVPLRLEDTPSFSTFPGRDGEVLYGEDVYVGYRSYDTFGREVAYPFGHGLSYTTFSYESVDVTGDGANSWTMRVSVRNTGERDGAEVVQLYVAPPEGSVSRPVHELRAFDKITLAPGEAGVVTLRVTPRDLAFWNARAERWQIEPGAYGFEIGASSRDIRLRVEVSSVGDGVVDPLRLDSTVGEWAQHPISAPFMQRMSAGASDALSAAPELAEMVRATPVMKLTSWGLGVTEEMVRGIVAQAAAYGETGAGAEDD